MSYRIIPGDCIEAMRGMDEASVDAIVTDPPYSLGFMGKAWDRDFDHAWTPEALRILKPGGHLLAFGGTRTYHRLACAIEDAGFEIRDCLAWLYGSGFPKSLDVSKAIDKAAGAEREVVGRVKKLESYGPNEVYGSGPDHGGEMAITAPATPEAQEWQGWGTALKPAHEPIVLARKPLTSTVAGNCLAHGTGALNVDRCRVDTDGEQVQAQPGHRSSAFTTPLGHDGPRPREYTTAGRWPANVILDPEAAALLDEQSGERQAGAHPKHRGAGTAGFHGWPNGTEAPERIELDSGGASRFFPTFALDVTASATEATTSESDQTRFRYQSKASRAERNAGLEGFEAKQSSKLGAGLRSSVGASAEAHGLTAGSTSSEDRRAANHHPTVKPIDLMRWLCRLVTPPGGTVLDPFAGSGTTGCAAVLEGFDFIGCEREDEYVAIAEARIAYWAQYEGAEVEAVLASDDHERRAEGQLDLLGDAA